MRVIAKRTLLTKVTTQSMLIEAIGAFGKLNDTTDQQVDAILTYMREAKVPFKGIKDKLLKIHKEEGVWKVENSTGKHCPLKDLKGILWYENVNKLCRNIKARWSDYNKPNVKVELTETEKVRKSQEMDIKALERVMELVADNKTVTAELKSIIDSIKIIIAK